MPPGKAIGDALSGRLKSLWRSGKNAGSRQTAKTQHVHVPHAKSAFSTSTTQAASTSPTSGGRLVNLLVEAFSPLLRAPGVQAAKQAGGQTFYEPAARAVGRTLSARASLHTAARPPTSGFGSVRPSLIPRSPAQVGLGSARNFSSARPVFQNVVQNAPLGLRVLGDGDLLEVRRFRKEIRAAMLKRQAAKGKQPMQPLLFQSMEFKTVPSAMSYYFEDSAMEAAQPTVQVVLPLNPVSEATHFLSITEDAQESKFFSALLMSDLRMLSELHGNHHARLRNLIQRLESAGCFEPDPLTGEVSVKAELDEVHSCIVVRFYGERWSLADVNQVLGNYTGSTWYQVIDLQSDNTEKSSSTLASVPSDWDVTPPGGLSRQSSSVNLGLDDAREHDRVAQSLLLPSPEVHSSCDSYVWGVEDFIHSLQSDKKPTFVQ